MFYFNAKSVFMSKLINCTNMVFESAGQCLFIYFICNQLFGRGVDEVGAGTVLYVWEC